MTGLLATNGVMLSASYGTNFSEPTHRRMTAMATRMRARPRRSLAPRRASTVSTMERMIHTPFARAGSGVRRLGVGIEHAGGIDDAGTGVDRSRDAQRLGDLLADGTLIDRRLGVDRDTAVAADRDRERDQLACLGAQEVGLLSSGAQHLIALDRVGAELGDLADLDDQLLAIGVPIEHRHLKSPDLAAAWWSGAAGYRRKV